MLTVSQIKALAPADKLYRVTDALGLLLEVKPSGVKAWRYRYKFNGKATMMALGNYPEVSLAQARSLRQQCRDKLDQGINPKPEKMSQPVAEVVPVNKPSFGEVYKDWYLHNEDDWTTNYALDVNQRCENHLLIHLGERPIDEITAMDMLQVFKKIEARGTLNMLKKVRGYASRVFRYGVGMGLCVMDPTRDLPSDIFKKAQSEPYASTTDEQAIGGIMRLLQTYHGHFAVGFALRLAPYVFLRPGELAGLRWDEVDFKTNLINIPAERMKMRRPHLVPLSTQARAILLEALQVNVGSEYVFPAQRYVGRSINAESLRAGLRRLGIAGDELTTHGFRHMASTLLHEQGWLSDAVERQLAHVESNKVKGTYNKALHLDVRIEMMQYWADYLDGLA